MSCIVLDIELADKDFNKEMRVYFDENVQGYSSPPLKTANPQRKQFDVLEAFTELCETVDVWITVSFPTFCLDI